jgi:hypothetical protein
MSKEIKAFKGFDKDFKCRDFQYEVGETYEHEGSVVRCTDQGFHSCKAPFDVWSYYPPTSRFAQVTASGSVDDSDDDSKIASAKITIDAEVSLPEFIQAGVDYILSNVKKSKKKHSTGNYSAATNTGDQSAATSTGDYSAASSTGYQSAATSTGDYSAASSTGNYSAASSTGDYSAASNTGYYSAATNTGYQSAASSTGDYSAASSTGNYSAATVEGENSIAMASGVNSKAKASKGSGIVLCEYNDDGTLKKIHTGIAGKGRIKPDVFYTVEHGKLAECS